MAIRLNKRQRILGGLVLQAMIALVVVLASPEIILLGEVITLQTAPMSPQELRSPVGIRLQFDASKDPKAGFAKIERIGPHWQLTTFTHLQPPCTDCKYIRRKADGSWGWEHYRCSPDAAKAIERELRMEAMTAGKSKLALRVEAVIRDGQIVKLRRAAVVSGGH